MWSVAAAIAVGLAVLAGSASIRSRLRSRELPAERKRATEASDRQRWLGAAAAAVGVGYVTNSAGWWCVVAGGVAGVVSFVAFGQLQAQAVARRQSELAAELPQVCDLLVVCVEAGLPVRAAAAVVATSMTGSLAELLAAAAAKTSLGVDEARVWSELGTEPALSRLGRELGRGAVSGVSLAVRLRALGVDARRAAAADAETKARRVGVQSVLPLMVCFLPAFVLLGLVPIIGGMVSKLFG
jgi:pilus assembly protein TadC